MITKLIEQLQKDPELYYAYQSNIAMSFYDEFYRYNKRHKNRDDIHKISNQAAKNFLNLLVSKYDE